MSRELQRRRGAFTVCLALAAFAGTSAGYAVAPAADGEAMFDLSKDKVLYCVGYAHLDTQWRWDFCTTIDKFIKATLDENFERFEKFPGYVFNFTGSVRYEMMKEYYPEKFEKLRDLIAKGRWFVSGSSVDEGDVNVPGAEAVIRHVLYGNRYFRREFGKESIDFMLPDCFGFPASMPSIWAHCGLKGFSTQKLTWGSAVGIPFKVGVWEGPDGRGVIAALDPGPYVGAIKGPVHTNPQWTVRIEENGRRYGVWADYHYYGVGDTGGAPKEEDIANYLASVKAPDAPIKVALVSSDQMYKDITPEQAARLPRYKGDLLLTEHSAGTLTSQAYMKRWNRKGEQLADAAERAAVAAHWLGGAEYPREKLYKSWVRTLANQMHDILPGTSIPRAYTYSWNDEIVGMNGFAAVETDAVGAISRALDTRAEGVPVVVYNPLAMPRTDLVEAKVQFDGAPPKAVCVFDPRGEEVPSQVLARDERSVSVLFSATVPGMSWSVFDVRPSETPYESKNAPTVTENSLENEHYRVTLDPNGDVASLIDKANGNRELLAAPHRLVFTYERPQQWPAWNMDWADRQKPPVDSLDTPTRVRIVEKGPLRVALEVERGARNSIVTQQIRLARGEPGRRVEFKTNVDWQSVQCALKAEFPLSVSNPKATYNWGLGTIDRGNNEPTKYEVPSHEWFDLTDTKGDYGVSVLEDCKFGSDKPADNTVRLTLLYTPGVRSGYLDQHSQDWGRHDMTYALYGHKGDWRDGRSEWQGRRLNQPLAVFQAAPHEGPLGKAWSLLTLNTDQVDIRAVKLAEEGDAIIVRLQELWGKPAERVGVEFAGRIAEAWEVDGQERRIGDARTDGKSLLTSLTPYSPRSFAVRLDTPVGKPRLTPKTPNSPREETVDLEATPVSLRPPTCAAVALPYDEDIVSTDDQRDDGRLDADGRTIPAEMLPKQITSEGIVFDLGPTTPGAKNAVACRGQTINLPGGPNNRLYLLACATEDTQGAFKIDGKPTDLRVQAWTGFVGQFDDRIWDREFAELDFQCEGKVTGFRPGFIKRDPIAWFCTHRHHPARGNESYKFSYLFKYGLDLPPGAKTLTLPDNDKIKLMAVTAARNDNDAVRPAAPLYDDFTGRGSLPLRHVYPQPPRPVHEGVSAVGKAAIERQASFDRLALGPPSKTDYADVASGRGIEFRYFDGDGQYRPHAGSGAKDGALPRLNDGQVAANDDDTRRCVWYDGEGRFFADLKRPVRINRVNAYSWHRSNRAPQRFSLWGAAGEAMPSAGFANGKDSGWTLLAVVNTKDLGDGGVHGSSVTGADGGPLGPYRYLLWVAEDVGQGTFFTEIDVDATE